jgi:rhamnosyl/mannosyltransferase
LKVLLVNKLYYPHIGGVEHHVRDLARGLKSHVDVRVLAANTGPKTVIEKIDGVDVYKIFSLGRFRSAPLAPTFGKWLKRLKSDIYHFHFPNPTGELAYLLTRPPGKLIVTYHSDIIRQKILLQIYQSFLKRFLHLADKIVVQSPNLVDSSPYLGNHRNKIVIVPAGIETNNFRLTEDIRRKVESIKSIYSSPIIFFLGRLIYYKGLEYLITAMSNVKAKLLIAGEGPLREQLQRQAFQADIAKKIVFLGKLSEDEKIAFYHACDIFVLPSVETSEAYGLVQLEAHACGKPVVSTNLPTGVPYVNLDGITGIVVPPRDSKALSGALNRLLADSELRLRLGENARKRVEREFNFELMIKKTLSIYQEIAQEQKQT